jgi:hypothetical protein
MERRDYLEREIEKMRAVLQKIFKLRVDRQDEVQAQVAIGLNQYFDLSFSQLQKMNTDAFRAFAEGKNASLLEFMGGLLYATVFWNKPDTLDKDILRKILILWDLWENKTKTFDMERMDAKEKITRYLKTGETCTGAETD